MATRIDTKSRRKLSAQNWLFVLLLIAFAGMLSWVARDYRKEWDVSQNARNTLSEPTIAMLRELNGPVTITSYATAQEDLRKVVRDFLAPYQRVKQDIARPSSIRASSPSSPRPRASRSTANWSSSSGAAARTSPR